MNEQPTSKQYPVCGTCRWWVRNPGDNIKQGDCYLNPPAMTPGGQKVPRPNMKDTERGCSHHAALAEGETVAVREKFVVHSSSPAQPVVEVGAPPVPVATPSPNQSTKPKHKR